MKKRNIFVQTAIASALLAFGVSALAGSVTTTKRTVATEAFGSAFTATTPVAVPNITYTFNTPGGIVINDGGSVSVIFKMTGAQWSSSAALLIGNAVAANLPAEAVVTAAPAVSTTTTTNDTLTVIVGNPDGVAFGSLANTGTAAATAVIGIGGTVTLTNLSGSVRYQAIGVTNGTPITVTGKVMNGTNVLEAETAASTAVDMAAAIASAFTASTETKKIDLTAVPAGSALTTGIAGANKVQLGKIVFSNVTGAQNDLDTTAALAEVPIVLGAPAFGAAFTVTVAPSTGTWTAKQAVQLYSDATCATALTGGAPTQLPLSSAITAASTSVVLSANGAATAAQSAVDVASLYVCSDYSGVTAGAQLTPFKPTISASYTKASTSYTGATLAANTGYDLVNNGAQKDVRSYIPAAAVGYTSFVRAINTGAIAAAVTGQFIFEDGTTSASGVLGTLQSGGSVTWTSSQIETAIGVAPAASARPRLRLTAPTNTMDAQSFFLTNANGNFSDATGAQ